MRRICIIGSLNTEVILGPVDRLPAWGSQTMVAECETRAAGSAVCVAVPLSKLGVPSTIVGSVGDDEAGRAIVRRIARENLPTEGIRIVQDAPTGVCVSVFDRSGERLYVSALGALEATTRETIESELLRAADAVLVTGFFVLPGLDFDDATALFAACRKRGATTLLDVGWDAQGWSAKTLEGVLRLLRETDVFLPNALEARTITNEEDVVKAARALQRMGARTVIVKNGALGAKGAFGERLITDPGFPVPVRDTTAAGEAFNAGVLYGMKAGFPPERLVRFANAVAATFLANKGAYGALTEVEARMAPPRDNTDDMKKE